MVGQWLPGSLTITHYDPQATWDPLCGSTAYNGNTSVIVGQCGLVLAPARPEDRDWYVGMFNQMENIPMSALRDGVNFNWESIAEYLDALGKNRGVNAGALIGHSGVRRYIMGEAAHERAATPEEIEAMRGVVREGMLAGAVGFSIGNFVDQGLGIFGITVPSSVATDEERYALGSVLGEVGTGVFQVSGGARGRTFGPAYFARDLARSTGRPAMYNLISQEINNPRRMEGAPPAAGGVLQVGCPSLRFLPVCLRRADLQPETGSGHGGG